MAANIPAWQASPQTRARGIPTAEIRASMPSTKVAKRINTPAKTVGESMAQSAASPQIHVRDIPMAPIRGSISLPCESVESTKKKNKRSGISSAITARMTPKIYPEDFKSCICP